VAFADFSGRLRAKHAKFSLDLQIRAKVAQAGQTTLCTGFFSAIRAS
jgi:hypothetical protein